MERCVEAASQTAGHGLGEAGRVVRLTRRRRGRLSLSRPPRRVEEQVPGVDGADAVDERVVGLGRQGPAAALEALE